MLRCLSSAILAAQLARTWATLCNRSEYSSYLCPAVDDGNLCKYANVFAPPVLNERGNREVDVNISLAWTDLVSIDERADYLTMRGDIQMWWRDCRWSYMLASMHNDSEGCVQMEPIKLATSTIQGFTEAFNAAGNSIRQGFARSTQDQDQESVDPKSVCHAADVVDVWNPVPPQLRLLTADTTQSRSNSDVYFSSESHVEPGLFSAFIQDDAKLKFRFTMNYENFPFDKQTIHIKLKFASVVNPMIVTKILHGAGGAEWKSYKEVISKRSKEEDYVESELSVHASKNLIERFAKKGFDVHYVHVNVSQAGSSAELRTTIEISRQSGIIFARFFLPLIMLTFVPFAGFFLPVGAVMPRVATGFISFLTLTVFRNMAYAMIPDSTTSLVWIDVVMTTLTEIVWLAVVQNVIAQVVNKRISLYAAGAIDSMAQVVFLGLWAFELVLLFATGFAREDPQVIMWLSQSTLVIVCVYMMFKVWYITHRIDRILLRALAEQLNDVNVLWHEPLELEPRERDAVFRWIDTNIGGKTGDITIEDCIAALKAHSMVFDKGFEAERHEEFLGLMKDALQEKADKPFKMKEFREHFDALVGAGIAKAKAEKRHHRRMVAAEALEPTPSPRSIGGPAGPLEITQRASGLVHQVGAVASSRQEKTEADGAAGMESV